MRLWGRRQRFCEWAANNPFRLCVCCFHFEFPLCFCFFCCICTYIILRLRFYCLLIYSSLAALLPLDRTVPVTNRSRYSRNARSISLRLRSNRFHSNAENLTERNKRLPINAIGSKIHRSKWDLMYLKRFSLPLSLLLAPCRLAPFRPKQLQQLNEIFSRLPSIAAEHSNNLTSSTSRSLLYSINSNRIVFVRRERNGKLKECRSRERKLIIWKINDTIYHCSCAREYRLLRRARQLPARVASRLHAIPLNRREHRYHISHGNILAPVPSNSNR